MNLALNLLPTKATASSQVSSSKSSNSRAKSESKTSFSDTLNKTVAQSDKAAGKEREQVTPDSTMDSVVPNDVPKKNDTATTKERTSADSAAHSEGDTTKTEENQDVLENLTDSALATQILLAIPVIATPVANMQSMVSTEQVPTAITAAVTSQPQSVTNLPEFLSLVQQVAAADLVNPSANNNQSTLPNLVQTGQESLAMSGELSGSVTSTVLGSAVAQENSSQVESTLNPNITIVSQTAMNGQNQVPQVETAANSSEVIVSQTAVGLQNQAVKGETTQDANGIPNKQEQQPSEQGAIPAVGANQEDRRLSSDLSDEGHKNSLTDDGTRKVAQALATEGTEVTNSLAFAPNLDAALVSTNGITASTKTTETQTQTTPFADVYQVIDQIVEQTKVITKPENTEMIMKLKPEHLGELTLKVAVENGIVNASFHSNNPEVRSLIETSLPQLKQELANTGLKVDNVSVYAGLSQFQPNQDQNQNQRQQLMQFTNKKSAGEFVEVIDGELTGGNIPGIGSQSGVDYRI